MGGEDFSRYSLDQKGVESLLFWVGGVPQAQWDAVKGDTTKLPSIHSPNWAPDAGVTIAAATEAMTAAALELMAKK
jgi:hippurate hydrolase